MRESLWQRGENCGRLLWHNSRHIRVMKAACCAGEAEEKLLPRVWLESTAPKAVPPSVGRALALGAKLARGEFVTMVEMCAKGNRY